jgi:FkbM family methyltransferase
MNISEKMKQVTAFIRTSETPLPLVLDLLRLQSADYLAECKGVKFDLRAGSFEWFTVLENIIREDYFADGVHLAEGATVLDIGANFGSFCILASKKVGPTGKVVAFEPNPAVFDRLVNNIRINKISNIQAFGEAVSDKDGYFTLNIHQRTAFSTLVDSVDERSNEGATDLKVRTRSINTLISEMGCDIDLLKIDCEGSEYSILQSFDPQLARRVRQISMEVHKIDGHDESEIGVLLRKLGFTVHEALPKLTAFRID